MFKTNYKRISSLLFFTQYQATNTSCIVCNKHLLIIIVDIFENILITCEKTDSVFQEHIFQGLAYNLNIFQNLDCGLHLEAYSQNKSLLCIDLWSLKTKNFNDCQWRWLSY